jgi:predicted NBD/HSP70 family sugar kinase
MWPHDGRQDVSASMIDAAASASGRFTGPADQQTIRRHNLALVLGHVARHGSVSRAQIAAATGLNKTTVSNLVADLVERRLLREDGITHSGSVGRPAVNVVLDGQSFVALGLEVNVDYLAFSAVDLLGRVRDEGFVQRDNRERDAQASLSGLALLVRQALERLRDGGLTAVGATLALPGLVDITRGELFVAPNLGWKHVPAAQILHDHLGGIDVEINVDNEANLGALAERWEGVGTDLADFIHVSGDVGVGAGVIIGGELYRGATGFGGEFGHMTLMPDGPPCACGGHGCVETYVGQEALLRLAGSRSPRLRQSAAVAAVGPVDALVAAADDGDAMVLEALETVGTMLGTALSSAANLLAPSAVVLGGYFADLHDWLRGPVEREMNRRVLATRWAPVQVLKSRLRRGAAVRGAAALSLRQVMADPARVGHRT